MSETFTCDDKDQLVAYLYDELGADERRRIDEHLRICAECAAEVSGLTHVREELATWAPPEAELGFTVVSTKPAAREAEVIRPARWWAPPTVSAWARAAAAVLVVAAGLSIANLQVRYGAEGFVVTTGWMTPSVAPAPASVMPGAVTRVATPSPSADWRPALSALETSLRQEIQAARSGSTSAASASAPASRDDDLTLQRIAQLIEQSERRQQQELALRLTQFGRDLEVQRRSDLVRINQGFGQFEGRAGAEIARQRQMLDYIMRVSAPPPQ